MMESPQMKRTFVMMLLISASSQVAWGVDLFDRHTSYWLRRAAEESAPVESLTSGQAAQFKSLGGGIVEPCIVVQTGEGNLTKALLNWGFRRTEDKPIPVLLVERFVTYDRDRGDSTVASGKGIMLFPGYAFDFDIGQVVPAAVGGDVQFTEDRKLTPVGKARLFGLDGSALPAADDTEKYDPLDHSGVEPRDFSGSWNVTTDGRWSGRWNLVVDEDGRASGTHISDDTQGSYDISGRVSGSPNRITLQIDFGNTVQSFEAFLWTKSKDTMAGVTTMAERQLGFYAKREKPKTKPEPAKKP